MKVLAFCLALSAAVSSDRVHHELPTIMFVGNAIDNLVREGMEYIRKLGKAHEPVEVPDFIPELNLKDDSLQVDLKALLTAIKLSKATDFIINNLQNNVFKLTSSFLLTFPRIHIDGKYEVKGTAANQAVRGKGDFICEVTELTAGAFTQVEILDNSLHMKGLKLNYTLNSIQLKETGLSIEGVTEKQLEDIFNKKLLEFFQSNEKHVTDMIAGAVLKDSNDIMKGKSLQELINWLKNFGH